MTQLSTLKNYLRSLIKKGEFTKEQYGKLPPQNAKSWTYQRITKNSQNINSITKI